MDATEKTLSVLDALGDSAGGNRLGDIAARAGTSKSTAHRILQRLVERGYARAEGDGVYVPGPKILAVAGQMLHQLDHGRYFGPMLRELHAELGHTVHLALLSGDEAVYVEKLENPQGAYQTASRVGGRMPLHCTAIGKAILAELPAADVRGILARRPPERRTPNTLTSVPAVEQELERIRRRGFAVDDEENERNIRCVAAAIFDNRARAIGAVSVSALTFDLGVDEAHASGGRVRATAHALSAALGAPPETLAAPAA
jgi:IclR family acetate operon transcriptional repressor